MADRVIGVGELDVVHAPGDVIKTFALGSCVAAVLMDPKVRLIGMVHVALPDSATNPERAKSSPGYFADTGIPALLDRMVDAGMRRGETDLIVKLIGGATVLDIGKRFDVGRKNQLAVRKVLWSFGLAPRSEDVGGTISRTVEVDVDQGRTRISSARSEPWEI
ncbi:MAG: chemotaxis protein CheD [Spirochaetaceae bacterium]|nr:chemotaxis protein CheD [Myxococcales bacterium]MCB9726397.1 chemotaxis protein CheD [Spirochaetaceae bacterium]HPG24683.1 chemotaxis protein CheD [Myxococcota bacterium]